MAEKINSPHTEEVRYIFKKIGREEMKQLAKEGFKQATKEWLDETYRKVGKGVVGMVWATIFLAAIYLIAWANGWHK